MTLLVVPREDVNSETARLTAWLVEDGVHVAKGQPICEVETSKIVFEIEAPCDGWLVHGAETGADVRFNAPIGVVVETEAAIPEGRQRLVSGDGKATSGDGIDGFTGKMTEKARRLIEEHGVPASRLPHKALITERDVRALLEEKNDFFSPLDERVYRIDHSRIRTIRTLVFGAGLGAMQVVDILDHDPRVQVIGYLDDNSELKGKTIYGFPVLGPPAIAEEMFRAGQFDAAIIAVSTSIAVRRKWYELLKAIGVPLVNAIDPTVKINGGVLMGEGNVICAFVHLGVETQIGNNNFISSYNSIEHHNLWGSHITTGPAVATSGCVEVGDAVKMGTGIFIQPHVRIGQGVQIASGSVLTRSIPDRHAVKVRVNTVITALDDPVAGKKERGDEIHEVIQ